MPRFEAISEFIEAVSQHARPDHELHDSLRADVATYRFVCECGEEFELARGAIFRTATSSEQLFARHIETFDGRRRMLEALQPRCNVAPAGWRCRRRRGHSGPCAAEPLLPPPGHYITSEPEFVGRMPVRTELTVLPADAPSQELLGFTVRETLGTHNLAHRVTVTQPEPADEDPGRYPDRFHRKEPV